MPRVPPPEPTPRRRARPEPASAGVLDAFTPARLAEVLLAGVAGARGPNGAGPAGAGPTAAVAAIVRSDAAGPELLLIERAASASDPWSGQMAFPGGRTDAADGNSLRTAARETLEEVGVDIGGTALGRLADLEGGLRSGTRSLRVTPHVCWWPGGRPALTLNHEVAAAVWVPVRELADRSRFVDYRRPQRPDERFPGIGLDGGRVVWGLTLTMLEDLFARTGHPLRIR
ncbi:MAG TPA: hypothetical protein DEP66_01405 [Acidimicrobiaceae bacterium]|nr:hypothetical protein [Acidimicrobiaceae bacterium]